MAPQIHAQHYDVLVVGATPAGIAAAISAARQGMRVGLTEPTEHVGGLMANGLGVTDISQRNAVGGIFREFIRRVCAHYGNTYGWDSEQARDCSDGFYFEPHVAELVFESMLGETPGIEVLRGWRLARNVPAVMDGEALQAVTFRTPEHPAGMRVTAGCFIDASYEGDTLALAGGRYRLGRESRHETGESYAGKVYMRFHNKEVLPGTTGEGDERIQAYNYRLCLTREPNLRHLPGKPADYRRQDYVSLIDDVRNGSIYTFCPYSHGSQRVDNGVVNVVRLPNGKSDTNNHHNALLSTDLPEENYPWPEADDAWREKFAERLRSYTLGLLWFCQNDPELPEWFRTQARTWGLAKDEYEDNGYFPRQVYVREARRMVGLYTFTGHDARRASGSSRAPLHPDSIAAGSYPLDSHATRKREPGKTALEGFFGVSSVPYQIPYGVIVPERVDGLLVPGAVSATHLGFSTLRMEPCWMALGQAAGTAAAMSVQRSTPPRQLPVDQLQCALLAQQQVLIWYSDFEVGADCTAGVQFFGSRGLICDTSCEPHYLVERNEAASWLLRILEAADSMSLGQDHSPSGSIDRLHRYGVLTDEEAQDFRPCDMLLRAELARWLNQLPGPAPRAAPVRDDLARLPLSRATFLQILFDAALHAHCPGAN